MSKPSLFAFAQANEAGYPTRLEDKLSPLSAPHRATADDFRAQVDARSTVSINMKPWKLRTFMQRGRYLSMQQDADAGPTERGISRDDVLKTQGAYLGPRMAFEGHFEQGEQFLYGALNMGGFGAPYYGIFCTVIRASVVHSLPCAYFPGDSVALYAKDKTTVDEPRVKTDAATPSCRGILATMKHGDDLKNKAEATWSEMLCSDHGYIEAIFVGDINPDSVEQIRMKKGELERLLDLVIKEKLGDLNDPAEHSAIVEFTETMKSMSKYGLDQQLVGV